MEGDESLANVAGPSGIRQGGEPRSMRSGHDPGGGSGMMTLDNGSDSDLSGFTEDMIVIEEHRLTLYEELKASMLDSQETLLSGQMRSEHRTPQNVNDMIPQCKVEKLIDDRGQVFGFSLRPKRSVESVKSIRSERFQLDSETYPHNFLHDYVVQTFVRKSDVSLDSAFPIMHDDGDKVTPDIIEQVTENDWIVIEITTRMVGSEKSLLSAYKEKLLKYRHLLQARQNRLNGEFTCGEISKVRIRYGIIVVTSDLVTTNINLSDRIVNELTIRFRFAVAQRSTLISMELIRHEETEMDSQSEKARLTLIHFDFSKVKSDETLRAEGFPEYTLENYNNLISEPLDTDKFKSDVDKLMMNAMSESGLLSAIKDPIRARENHKRELNKKFDDYKSEFSNYIHESKDKTRRVSSKRLILLPFLNLAKSEDDSVSATYVLSRKFARSILEIAQMRDDNKMESEPIDRYYDREKTYFSLWSEVLTKTVNQLNENARRNLSMDEETCDSPAADVVCKLEQCEQWEEMLRELEEDPEEGGECDTQEDKALLMRCHDLDVALYDGGVDKASNDRKRYKRVNVMLDNLARVELAKKGVQGKMLKDDPTVLRERLDTKRPISFDSSTADIDRYMKEWYFFQSKLETEIPLGLQAMSRLIARSQQQQSSGSLTKIGTQLLDQLIQSKIGLASYIMSSIMLEINASTKQHCKKDQFIVKRLREFPIWIMIKPTNSQSHTFYSLAWDASFEINMIDEFDHSRKCLRLFAEVMEFDDLRVTPFYSVNKSKIPNLCQAFPRLVNIMAYAFDECKVVPPGMNSGKSESSVFHHPAEDLDTEMVEEFMMKFETAPRGTEFQRMRKFWKLTLFNWLVSMHNKAEVEEHLTLTRFIFMEGFVRDPAVVNPGKMLESFSKKVRSRMTIWVIMRLDSLIRHIYENEGFDIKEERIVGSKRTLHKRADMENFFIGEPIDDEGEAINSFYYGYGVDKNQIPEKNMSAQLYEKILDYEDKFKREDIGNIGCKEVENVLETPFHYYSMNMIKGMCSVAKGIIESRTGVKNAEKKLEEAVLSLYSRASIFDTLSTLKSSTTFSSETEEPDTPYPRRQKLIQTSKDKIYSGKTLMHEILMDSLHKLLDQSSIFNDLFKKNQHGGLREIYIMNSDTRVVQHFIETAARAICSLFPSETMTNPKSKTLLLTRHNEMARLRFKNNTTVTLCTSDDARKWNQGHYVHKFYVMMVHLMPREYHEVFRAICYLWQNKKILIDEDLIRVFKMNPELVLQSEVINKMHQTYLAKGEAQLWMNNGSRYIKVRTGMMQGILHYTSSLFHTICNEFIKRQCTMFMREIISKARGQFIINHEDYIGEKMPVACEPVITVMQSSDDSSMIITAPYIDGVSQMMISFLTLTCFKFKHCVGASIGIHLSKKSTTNTLNIMEFNSTWYFLGNRFQPYVKQCLAALVVSEHGNLLMRMQENYNAITSSLENGASFLCCSIMQVAQAIQHYMFLGSTMTHNFLHYAHIMDRLMLPTLGFFLMDNPAICGLPGLECLHYILAKTTDLKHYYRMVYEKCEKVKDMETKRRVINHETVAPSLHNSLCMISHGQNMKLAKLKESMELPDGWLDAINDDPSPLTRKPNTKEEARIKVAAKLHSPGMSNAFNSMGIFCNIAAESVYILTSKCNTIANPSNVMDMTDYKKMIEDVSTRQWGLTKRTREEEMQNAAKEVERDNKKFSLLFLCHRMEDENTKLNGNLENISEEEKKIYCEESLSYLKTCFARYDDYDLIQDHQSSLPPLMLYRDDKSLRNRFLNVKVSSSTLEDNLKPYDIVIWKLLGSRSMIDNRAGNYAWLLLKSKYSWLKDTWKETLLASPFTDSIQLLNFLSRLDKSGRIVKLQGVSMFQTIPGDHITNLVGCNLLKGFSTNLSASMGTVEAEGEHKAEANQTMKSEMMEAINKKKISLRVAAHYVTMCCMMKMKEESLLACIERIASCTDINLNVASRRLKSYAIMLAFNSETMETKEILKHCQEKNIGLVGGYSLVQDYDAVTCQYTGFGVWEGLYEGINVEILVNSKATGPEFSSDDLIKRKQALEDSNPSASKGYRIKVRKVHETYLVRVVIGKEIAPRELANLIQRWCENNKVINNKGPAHDDFLTFENMNRGVKKVSLEIRELNKKFRRNTEDTAYGILSNFVMYGVPSPKNVVGAPVFINRRMRRTAIALQNATEGDVFFKISEEGVLRLMLRTARCTEELPSDLETNQKSSLVKRSRTEVTILSLTPSVNDLTGHFIVKIANEIPLELPNVDEWVTNSPLSYDKAHMLLTKLFDEESNTEMNRYFDVSEMREMMRMQCKKWLRDRKILTDSPTDSCEDEQVSNFTAKCTLKEGPDDFVVDTFEWMHSQVDVMTQVIYVTVRELAEERAKKETGRAPDLEYLENVAYWTGMAKSELDAEISQTKAGGTSVNVLKKKSCIESHRYIHNFLAFINDEDWKIIVQTGVLPRRYSEMIGILECLLGKRDSKRRLKIEIGHDITSEFEFPALGKTFRKRKRK